MKGQEAEARRLLWLDDLRRDLAYGVRSLRKSPGFAAIAILTLALGIGATTTIYSVVDAILLQPLPFADSDRLVRIVENEVGGLAGQIFQRGVNYKEFAEWRARTATLEDVVAVAPNVPMLVGTDDGPKRLWGARVSANTFAILGSNALFGRVFTRTDEANPNVVVLGFDTWRRLFRADRSIVGQELDVQGNLRESLTVIGVLPPGFAFPTGPRDYYRPIDPSRPTGGTLIGRLRSGVSIEAAMQEADAIGTAIRPPRRANALPLPVPRFDVQSLKDETVRELRPALRVLFGAVGVVLLIVCVNVANLLLARGTARQREIAVRTAIGASRGRILRQVFAECLVLAAIGGVLGAVVGAGGVLLVKRMASVEAPGIFQLTFGPAILPRVNEVGIDSSVFATALGVAALACFAFGLLPAVQLSRSNWIQTIASRTSGLRRRDARLRSLLVVSQLVMATVLLVTAGLLINSFVKLTTVEKGYDASNVLVLQLLFPGNYPTARKAETIDTVLARLRAHPDVQYAGFSRAGVFIGEEITYGTFVSRKTTLAHMRASREQLRIRSITEGFLPAMGIPFLGGRDLSAEDFGAASSTIVLNRRAADVLFGSDTAVGERVDWHFDTFHIPVTVAGVVEELRNESLDQEPFPEVFVDYRLLWNTVQRLKLPIPQQDQTALGLLSFAIRTKGAPQSLISAATQIVRAADANAGIDAIVPLEQLVDGSIARQRFYAVVLGVFAMIAAVLAAIGVYGVLAYAVVQRKQEIGIRMALGAERGSVVRLILRNGVFLTTAGIGIGVAAALATTRLVEGMLFGITPFDIATFVAVSAMFGSIAMCACYLPARRAATVNPIIALRAE